MVLALFCYKRTGPSLIGQGREEDSGVVAQGGIALHLSSAYKSSGSIFHRIRRPFVSVLKFW